MELDVHFSLNERDLQLIQRWYARQMGVPYTEGQASDNRGVCRYYIRRAVESTTLQEKDRAYAEWLEK